VAEVSFRGSGAGVFQCNHDPLAPCRAKALGDLAQRTVELLRRLECRRQPQEKWLRKSEQRYKWKLWV
jgi:hypothetical protein